MWRHPQRVRKGVCVEGRGESVEVCGASEVTYVAPLYAPLLKAALTACTYRGLGFEVVSLCISLCEMKGGVF